MPFSLTNMFCLYFLLREEGEHRFGILLMVGLPVFSQHLGIRHITTIRLLKLHLRQIQDAVLQYLVPSSQDEYKVR